MLQPRARSFCGSPCRMANTSSRQLRVERRPGMRGRCAQEAIVRAISTLAQVVTDLGAAVASLSSIVRGRASPICAHGKTLL
jgi:hypothetical protein